MSDKTTKKTKAELLEMLAEAVRNTQPRTSGATGPEPIRHAPEPKPKTGPVSKRTTKTKKAPASARRRERRR